MYFPEHAICTFQARNHICPTVFSISKIWSGDENPALSALIRCSTSVTEGKFLRVTISAASFERGTILS